MSCMVSINSYQHLIKNAMTTWIFTKFNYCSLLLFCRARHTLFFSGGLSLPSAGRTPLSTLMNIAKVQGVWGIDGIHLNQQENRWHTLTFSKVLIGSSKIQQATYFTQEWNGRGVEGDQPSCNSHSKIRRPSTEETKPKTKLFISLLVGVIEI